MSISYPLTWPTELLIPATVSLAPQSQSRSAGQSTTGFEQIVQSPALRWGLKLTGIFVRTREQILAWRAIEGQLAGRAGTIRVPIYDWWRGPAGRRGQLMRQPGRLHLLGGGAIRAKTVAITLSANAPVNATTISVVWAEDSAPQPGQHFALGPHLHRIVGMKATGASAAALTIGPWLRSAYQAGTPLEFDEPAGVFRLARDDGMSLDLEGWRLAQPSVEFVEAS